jgi:hypothetical protein
MKFNWLSNGAWASTGYGTQTRQILTALKAAGHDPAVTAFYGVEGAVLNWGGIPHYPKGFHAYGSDVASANTLHHGARLVISFLDIWVVVPEMIDSRVKWAAYFPIDHDPIPLRRAKLAIDDAPPCLRRFVADRRWDGVVVDGEVGGPLHAAVYHLRHDHPNVEERDNEPRAVVQRVGAHHVGAVGVKALRVVRDAAPVEDGPLDAVEGRHRRVMARRLERRHDLARLRAIAGSGPGSVGQHHQLHGFTSCAALYSAIQSRIAAASSVAADSSALCCSNSATRASSAATRSSRCFT